MNFPGHLAAPPRAKSCSCLKSLDSTSNSFLSLLSCTNLQWPFPFTKGYSTSFSFPYSGNHQGWPSIITSFVVNFSSIHLSFYGETLIVHWISMGSFKFPSLFTNDETIWLLLDEGPCDYFWTEVTCFASRPRYLRTWCSLVSCHRNLEAMCWNGSIKKKNKTKQHEW